MEILPTLVLLTTVFHYSFVSCNGYALPKKSSVDQKREKDENAVDSFLTSLKREATDGQLRFLSGPRPGRRELFEEASPPRLGKRAKTEDVIDRINKLLQKFSLKRNYF